MGCMFPYLLLLKQIYSLVKMKKILLIVTFFLFLLSNSCIGKKLPVPLTYMEKIDEDGAGFACPNVEKHLLYSFVGENGKNRKFYEFISEDSLGQLWYVDDGNEVPKRIPTKYDRYNEGEDHFEDGFPRMKYLVSPDGKKLYVATTVWANSDGWVTDYQLFLIDCESLSVSMIVECAAIMVTDQGFKIAECRLTNEKEAETTADEIWAIHDVYLDWQGKIIVDDKEHEYSDTRMVKKYSTKKKSDMLLVKGFCDVK